MINVFIRNSIESCQIIFIIKYDALKWHFNGEKWNITLLIMKQYSIYKLSCKHACIKTQS